MKETDQRLLLAATDLSNHLACRHLTELDRAVTEGRQDPPAWRDPALEQLRERGLAHELRYVEFLRKQGRDVVELREMEGDLAADRTLIAMRSGADVIVQAALGDGCWRGRADLLLRVEEPSTLGAWSYEVADTKLALETRGGTVLQLCLYSDLLGQIQGREPELMHVVKPGEGFTVETFRFADFQAYYRLVRRRLEAITQLPPSGATYPDPAPHCDVCRWWQGCDARRRADDHLCLVAGIGSLHIEELHRQGIRTLEQFAEESGPLREKPERGSEETFERIRQQARIQLQGRREGRLVHELLPVEEGRGLTLLPVPSPGDVFFDIESDPFVDEGGLEYLLGVTFADDEGALRYRAFWGLDRGVEREATQQFIDFVMERWQADPGMHIYHFSPYEPAAIKRLIGRHGTREAEVDRLLRGRRFVDLLAVSRQGLRASVESYSLKELERFFDFERDVELREAGAALRRVACALELGAPGEIATEDRAAVEHYNRDDCLSTAGLRDWLERQRAELEVREGILPRPELQTGEASDSVEERTAEMQEVFDRLAGDLSDDRDAWGQDERSRWLLAHELAYFRREDKCAWWEFFRLHGLEHADLLDERKALSGLRYDGEVGGGTARCPIHRYRFPPQEVDLRRGSELHEVGRNVVGTVNHVDRSRGTLDMKKRGNASDLHPLAVLALERVPARPIDGAVLEFARSVAEHGVDGAGPYRAARDLLLKTAPRLSSPPEPGEPLRKTGEDVIEAAARLARDLNGGVLPIQGPPGTGKTYAASRMIVALARERKRIGVAAVSHGVIRNLLDEVLRAARESGVPLEAVHKVSERTGDLPAGLEEVTSNDAVPPALDRGKIVGGTAWLWARDNMIESLDVLFVDEAGQLSLAHTLGAARCARNLVLIGDPQQLEQPQRAAHPEGAQVTALVHLLDGKKTPEILT